MTPINEAGNEQFLMNEVHRLQDERDKRYDARFEYFQDKITDHIHHDVETHASEARMREADEARLNEKLVRFKDNVDQQFVSAEKAVDLAITARREVTEAVFAASERAITKAEEAQRAYNERSNEFRGQLDDQAKSLLTRSEANVSFGAMDMKIQDLKKEIVDLREYKSRTLGMESATSSDRLQLNWSITLAVAVTMTVVGWVIAHLVK